MNPTPTTRPNTVADRKLLTAALPAQTQGGRALPEDFLRTLRRILVRSISPPGADPSGRRRAGRHRSGAPPGSWAPIEFNQFHKSEHRNETMKPNQTNQTDNRIRAGTGATANEETGFMKTAIREGLSRLRLGAVAAILATVAFATPAHATIDNEATANGTFGGNPVVSNTATQNVPVAAPNPALTGVKSFVSVNANVVGDSDLQAGDTITYSMLVTNTGNVTLTNVVAEEDTITFGGTAGTGSFSYSPASVASLAPGANTTITITYELSALDIYRGAAAGTDGVENTAHAQGTFGGTDYDSPVSGPVTATIAADPELLIAKTYVITTDGGTLGSADVGDEITYTYTITNTGNVAIEDVTVSDTHEPGELHAISLTSGADMQNEAIGAGSDPLGVTSDAAVIGSWDLLGPESVITFTYVHTVGQAEFEDQ
jgi:uncharacterized repeat protein (TIGR01451 family)